MSSFLIFNFHQILFVKKKAKEKERDSRSARVEGEENFV
jgi:hypothetical protein